MLKTTDWSGAKKWKMFIPACCATFLVGINSTSLTALTGFTNERFDISDAQFPHSYWPVTAWNSGAAITPMLVIPILERYGMKPGYLGCFALFTIFVVPQAVVQSFRGLIVCRFFAGSFAGVIQDIMDGLIADMWPQPERRSLPVTLYCFSLLAGVSFGPVYGGAIVSRLSWRWVLYTQIIINCAFFPALMAFIKETRSREHQRVGGVGHKNDGPQDLNRIGRLQSFLNSVRLQVSSFLFEAMWLPFYLLFTEPVVFFFTLLSSLSYGLVFLGTQSVTEVFCTLYGWSEYQAGIVQCSLVLGQLIGVFACLAQNRIFAKRSARTSLPIHHTDNASAETRLYICILGSFVGLTGGLFWYGWTSPRHDSLHWMLPATGLGIIGFGSVTVMQAIMVYVTDAYEKYAASASTAVCFGENLMAALLPLATKSMYTSLGFQWASSVLALIAFTLSFAPVILLWKGRSVRQRSPFITKATFQ